MVTGFLWSHITKTYGYVFVLASSAKSKWLEQYYQSSVWSSMHCADSWLSNWTKVCVYVFYVCMLHVILSFQLSHKCSEPQSNLTMWTHPLLNPVANCSWPAQVIWNNGFHCCIVLWVCLLSTINSVLCLLPILFPPLNFPLTSQLFVTNGCPSWFGQLKGSSSSTLSPSTCSHRIVCSLEFSLQYCGTLSQQLLWIGALSIRLKWIIWRRLLGTGSMPTA